VGDKSKTYTKEEVLQKYNSLANKYASLEPVQEFLLGARKLRRQLLQRAYGKVLEIAVGTGANLPYYPVNCEITAIDNSESMLRIAQKKKEKLCKKVRLLIMDAEELGFPDQSFDTVVSTLSTCTFPDPIVVLREMSRVCQKNGRILLLEHGRSDRDWLANYQDRTENSHSEKFGCIWNRDPLNTVNQAGLKIISYQRYLLGTVFMIEAQPSKS